MLDNLKITESRDVLIDPEPLEAEATRSKMRVSLRFPPVGADQSAPDISLSGQATPSLLESEADAAQLTAAVAELQRRADRFGDVAGYHLQLGYLLLELNRLAEAADHFRTATQFSTVPIYRYSLAETLYAQGTQSAGHDLLVELAGESYPDAILRLAEIDIESSRFEDARSRIDKVQQLDPLSWQSNLLAGSLALNGQEFDVAIRYYRQALEDRPRSAVAYHNMAISYYFLGQYPSALRHLRKALAINPWYENALIFFSDLALYADAGYDLPVRYLQQYADYVGPKKSVAQRLADLYRNTSDWRKGISVLQSVSGYESDSGILNNLGVLWFTHDIRKAQYYFQQSTSLYDLDRDIAGQRGSEMAAINLVWSFLQSNEPEKAESLAAAILERAASGETEFARKAISKVAAAYVWALEQQNNTKEAIRYAEHYLESADSPLRTAIDIGNTLTNLYIFSVNAPRNAVRIANKVYKWCRELPRKNDDERRVVAAINNLAFAHLENGQRLAASALLSEISRHLYHNPFVTATFGLYAYRSGKSERGAELYHRAIRLATAESDQVHIRAKFQLERARWSASQGDARGTRKAIRKLQKLKVRSGRSWVLKGIQQAGRELVERRGKG